MKKLSWLTVLIFASVIINAQKIKVKDGVVLLDETPLVKIEGKVGMVKQADFTYTTLDGKPILKLKEGCFEYFIPVFETFYYYNIEFPLLNKKVTTLINFRYISEKKITEWLFVKITPPLLKNNALDSAAVNAFISKSDNSQKIQQDTTFYNLYEAANCESLKNTKNISRNITKPVHFIPVGGGKTVMRKTTYTFDIDQGETIIGRLEKIYESDPGLGQVIHFCFYKKTIPFKVGDQTYNYALVGYTKANQVYTEILTFVDKKKHKSDATFRENSEDLILKFLTTNDYL
jgi:hypothetical protein